MHSIFVAERTKSNGIQLKLLITYEMSFMILKYMHFEKLFREVDVTKHLHSFKPSRIS